jgi:hypothetical protein
VVQQIREADVRTLHRLQLRAQTALVGPSSRSPILQWLLPKVLPLVFGTGILPRVQRRMFFGVPLPPLDPAFSF